MLNPMKAKISPLFFIPLFVGCSEKIDDRFVGIKSDLMQIHVVIELRVLDKGPCIKGDAGLSELVKEGYLDAVRSDSWGNEYRFMCDGTGQIVVYSTGPNGSFDNCSGDDVCFEG